MLVVVVIVVAAVVLPLEEVVVLLLLLPYQLILSPPFVQVLRFWGEGRRGQ